MRTIPPAHKPLLVVNEEPPERSAIQRVRRLIVGPPRDVSDPKIFHHVSLIAFLAWVGLGADGLSSSAYGPEEAYKALGSHSHLSILGSEERRVGKEGRSRWS